MYRFSDAAGRVLYLGRAVSLRRRVVSYWGDLGDRGHLAPMVTRIARLEAVVCDSAHEAAWLERNLLPASLPPWNRAPSGGQEKEVWIRLSESARAPGVAVVHRPSPSPGARHFGPYLGGLQVRRAASGLSRVLPLAYAGGPPSGTRQEMARVLGVSAGERDELAREGGGGPRPRPGRGRGGPRAPVRPPGRGGGRARLRVRGPAAAGTRGARLGDRRAEGHQGDAGRLRRVRLGGRPPDPFHGPRRAAVRLGAARLRCAAARRHVAATPPEWAGFAHRNAELAARLVSPAGSTGRNDHDGL